MSKLGFYTESYIDYLNSKYDDFKIISHVIMPNHVHLIICVDAHIKKQDTYNDIVVNEMMRDISKQCGRLSYIISIFKRSVSNFAKKNNIHFAWQTRFHDRIIRDHNEFNNIDNYIKNNIINWQDDEFYPTINR